MTGCVIVEVYLYMTDLPDEQMLWEDNENLSILPACSQNEGIKDYVSGNEF